MNHATWWTLLLQAAVMLCQFPRCGAVLRGLRRKLRSKRKSADLNIASPGRARNACEWIASMVPSNSLMWVGQLRVSLDSQWSASIVSDAAEECPLVCMRTRDIRLESCVALDMWVGSRQGVHFVAHPPIPGLFWADSA